MNIKDRDQRISGFAGRLVKKVQETPAPENLDTVQAESQDLLWRLTKHSKDVRLVPVTLIDEDPNQPRDDIDEESEDFKGFVASIEQNGLLQPLVVEFKPDAQRFLLIAGERRLRAVRKLGWTDVNCEIHENLSSSDRLAFQMIENVQRQQFKPVEYARGMFALKEHLGADTPWRVVEELLGISETRRKQYSNLLKLDETIQKLIVAPGAGRIAKNGLITEAHGRALWLLRDSPQKQRELIKKIQQSKEGISGHDALKVANEMLGKRVRKIYTIRVTSDFSIPVPHVNPKDLLGKLEMAITRIRAEQKVLSGKRKKKGAHV